MTITFAELNERGITPDDIAPFVLYPQMRENLPAQQIGLSYLDRCPLIVHDEKHLTVALPSALSVAVRDYVIASIIKGGLTESFDDVLAENYSKLFFETPLLGGPMRAPVHVEASQVRTDGRISSSRLMKVTSSHSTSFCRRCRRIPMVALRAFIEMKAL